MNSHELHDRKLICAYVENELIKAFNKLYKDYKKITNPIKHELYNIFFLKVNIWRSIEMNTLR